MDLKNQPFRQKIKTLLHMNSTPPEIALGVAIGVFICTLPVYGLHTVLMIIAAVLIKRANKVAIFIGTNFSQAPTLPFITWAGYEIGRAILPGRYPPFSFSFFRHFDFRHFGDFYTPLFIGSVVLGILCGGFFYGLTYVIVTQRNKWKEHQGRGA